MKKVWDKFCAWRGWRALGSGCIRTWQVVVGWKIWGQLFGLPLPVVVLLCVLCGAGLLWVFAGGREQWVAAYALYVLSAYSLAALCIKLPSGIRSVKVWLRQHPKIAERLINHELKFKLELYFEQLLNFGYGVFKICSGVVLGSAWVGADGIYNFVQALIQLFQILRRKKPGTIVHQWKSYRFCGILVLLMHLTLIGIVFQMVNWHRVEESGEIMVIATAAFAFYKFIRSFIELAKDRKHKRPIDSSVRMMEFAQAVFAIFSLQVSLLHTFGTGESWEHILNLTAGCVVCLCVSATGVYMICRGNREIKQLQER